MGTKHQSLPTTRCCGLANTGKSVLQTLILINMTLPKGNNRVYNTKQHDQAKRQVTQPNETNSTQDL